MCLKFEKYNEVRPHYLSNGNNTNDKVFLLSADEVNKYFNLDAQDLRKNRKKIATKATNYAKRLDDARYKKYFDDRDEWYNSNSNYWLRSLGNNKQRANYIFNNGILDVMGHIVEYPHHGVRPAIWLTIKSGGK